MTFLKLPHTPTIPVTPFTVHIPDSELADLRTLLKLTPLPPKTYENSNPEVTKELKYGVSREWVAEAKKTWLEEFDWRKTEAKINQYPNFKATIPISSTTNPTLDVHFVGIFSPSPTAIPLLLLHGFPSSILEFYPLLAKAVPNDKYHFIIPSLPGFGFSSPPPLDKEFKPEDIAEVFNKLMVGLGFGEKGYIVQGGDMGSVMGRLLGVNYKECKAVHTIAVMMQPPKDADMSLLTDVEKGDLDRMGKFFQTGFAYGQLNATRPSTAGFLFSGNPVGILAWLGGMYLTWTDIKPSTETLLEIVSLYYFTNTYATCVYPYRHLLTGATTPDKLILSVPVGFSSFPYEISRCPKDWAATTVEKKEGLWFRDHHGERGGHFPALEVPEVLWKDLDDFCREVWK